MAFIDSLLGRKQPPLIGLDISSSAAKMVELSRATNGAWVLDRFATEPLEPGCVVDGSIERFDEVSEALKRLIRKSGTRAKNVAMAIPSTAVITKKIVLSASLSEQELEVQVEADATQYIPFPLEEVSLDFCVIGPNQKNQGEVDVLLAATRKERVEELNNLAVLIGLKPIIVDVESYAVRHAVDGWLNQLESFDKGGLIALVKMGARNFNLQIIRGNDVLHDSDHGIGGYQLTQKIAKHYGMSFEEAELKKKNGELSEDYEDMVLNPFIHEFSEDVRRALQFFFTSSPFGDIEHIGLYGGGCCVSNIEKKLEQHIKIPVKLLHPFEEMEYASMVNKNKLNREAPMYLVACGLAMRRFFL